MKKMKDLIVPTITPFDEKGKIDPEGIKAHFDFLIKSGVQDFYILGTTGEVFLMNKEERKMVAELVVEYVGDRGNIFIQVGSISTKEACDLAQHAESIGATHVSSVPPYYYKHNKEEVFFYFGSLVRAVTIGSDNILMSAILCGAKGSVSGNANVFPEIFIEFYQDIKEKNYDKAHEKQIIIRHIAGVLKNGANLAYFKQALIYRGFKPIFTRKPLLGLNLTEKNILNNEIKEIIKNYL